MKEIRLVLAVTAAMSAHAFADEDKTKLSVYGVGDVGYGYISKTVKNSSTSMFNPGSTTKYDQLAVEFNGMTSSLLGFLATDEMGDGTKAALRIETGIGSSPMAGFSQTGALPPLANGTTIDQTKVGDRELNVSVGFTEGTTIKVGFGSSPIRDVTLAYAADPGETLVGNILKNDPTLGFNRATSLDVSQQIGGLKLTASAVKNKTTTTLAAPPTTTISNDSRGYQLAAQYARNAFSASLAYQRLRGTFSYFSPLLMITTSDLTQRIAIAGASYDLGVIKLFGEYASIKNDNWFIAVGGLGGTMTQPVPGNGFRTYTSLGVQVPYRAVLGFAQFSTGTVSQVSSQVIPSGPAESRQITGITVGAKYNMSKRTYAYASFGSTNLKPGSVDPNVSGIRVRQLAIGLVRSF